MQHNVRLIPSSTDQNPENATVGHLGFLEKSPFLRTFAWMEPLGCEETERIVAALKRIEDVPLEVLARAKPFAALRLAHELLVAAGDDPTLTPYWCRYCGDRHHLCPLHGDMGCDLQSANDECELCKGENEARKNDDDDAL